MLLFVLDPSLLLLLLLYCIVIELKCTHTVGGNGASTPMAVRMVIPACWVRFQNVQSQSSYQCSVTRMSRVSGSALSLNYCMLYQTKRNQTNAGVLYSYSTNLPGRQIWHCFDQGCTHPKPICSKEGMPLKRLSVFGSKRGGCVHDDIIFQVWLLACFGGLLNHLLFVVLLCIGGLLYIQVVLVSLRH